MLQVIADHKIVLWTLLGLEILGFLQLTVLYRPFLRLFEWVLDDDVVQDVCAQNRLLERYHGFCKRNLWRHWVRVVGFVQSFILAALAIAGFLLL